MHIRFAAALLGMLALTACGAEKKPIDWRNRELPWKYGPTHTATAAHLAGTGTEGNALAEGWKIRLTDGKQLTAAPYKLDEGHKLLGKVKLVIELYDRNSQRISVIESPAVSKDAPGFTLDVPEEQAKQIWDLIVWYRDA